MSYDELKREALKLRSNERVEFAYCLLESVDEEADDEHERLWMEEIERRCQEIDEGKAQMIPGEEVFAELWAKLK